MNEVNGLYFTFANCVSVLQKLYENRDMDINKWCVPKDLNNPMYICKAVVRESYRSYMQEIYDN